MTAVSENLILSVRNKKSHETRFYLILNALSDSKVDIRFFCETLRFLSIPELGEIVEERISKNKCGYVLCDYTINIHPTAMVSLNVSKRKIFDISNRKKFCSDWCYGAHKHISSQLPDEPMWRNPNVNLSVIDFYPKNAPGCEGEIVYDEKLLNNATTLNSDESKNQKNQIVKPAKNAERIEKIEKVIKSLDKLVVKKSKNLDDVIKKIKDNAEKNKDRKIVLINDYLEDKQITTPSSEENILVYLRKVKNVLSDWITEKTRDYFFESKNNENVDDDDDDDREAEVEEDNEKIIYDEDSQPMSLPILDSSNQVNIRRNILIKKAKTACIPLIADFEISCADFMNEFEQFIKTCRLTSTNILFSSKEFKWLIIVLIDLLSCKFENIKNINKTGILNKYGIVRMKLYDKILMEINNTISQPLNILVSSQGDNSYV